MFPGRTVQRLRMRARDGALARHGRVLVEDALRTATLPGDGARLVLLRKLALPPFRAGSAPQSVALVLERRCRAVTPVHVDRDRPADDATLAAAPAVSFADTVQALGILTRRLLAGARPRAWCWPLLAPGYRAELPLPDALARVARAVAATPEVERALPLWLDTVVAGGGGEALLAGLGRDPGRLAGLPPPARLRPPADRPRAAWARLLASLHARGEHVAARHWIVALAPPPMPAVPPPAQPTRRAPDPAPSPSRAAAARDAGRTRRGGARLDAPAPRDAAGAPAGDRRDREPANAARAPAPGHAARGAAIGAREGGDRVRAPDGAGAADSAPAPAVRRAPTPAADPETLASAHGGLLFLLPVLERVGLPGWLAANPEWRDAELAARILERVLDRLRAPADEPLRALAADLPPAPALAGRLDLPALWAEELCRGPTRVVADGERQVLFDAGGRLPLALWREPAPGRPGRAARQGRRGQLPPTERLLCDAWINASRRRLRRRARIGIATLVRRPARVALTATNVDVWLAPETVSLAVRRHGLDLDPGWVPWLGRVVRFHYDGDPG